MPDVELRGCTPEPLMGYLKALGVLRLVSEKDPAAAGFWQGGWFILRSALDEEALTKFFLHEYRPTPIVGPWGARSGFYPGSSESSAREALNAISANADARFTPFRNTICAVRDLLTELGFEEKVRDEDKLILMQACRNRLPDELVLWLDAVYILTQDGRKFPPLLGTGGNEGSGSYVSTFAQVVVSLLIEREGDDGLRTALYDEPGATLSNTAVGHFHPGAVGGPNSSQGFSGGGGVNQWDFLFAIEGTLLFAGAAARRFGTDTKEKAAFPFTVSSSAVGYGSAAEVEETSDGSRAELWLPLWSQPATYTELARLYAEGRAQVGRKQARSGVEFAKAIAGLGVSRGIDAFIRYGFLKRNGLSFFAAPLGRFAVVPHPEVKLLDDPKLGEWLERFRRACRDKDKTPARYLSALRDIDRAVFTFATRSQTDAGGEKQALRDVLVALGKAERVIAAGRGFRGKNYLRPLQGLDPQWLNACDDDTPEFRLAAALASVAAVPRTEIGPLRVHLEPVAFNPSYQSFGFDDGSRSAVWGHAGLAANLAAVFDRRLTECEQADVSGVALGGKRTATLDDVAAFLAGETDDGRLEDLLWGLTAIDWHRAGEFNPPTDSDVGLPREFGLLRLLVHPVRLKSGRDDDREPAWRRSGGGRGRSSWKSGRDDDREPAWVLPAEYEPAAETTPDPVPFRLLAARGPSAVPSAVNRAADRLRASLLIPFGRQNRGRRGEPLTVRRDLDPTRLLAAMPVPLSANALATLAARVLYPPAVTV